MTLDTVDDLSLLYSNQDKLGEAEIMYIRALQGRGHLNRITIDAELDQQSGPSNPSSLTDSTLSKVDLGAVSNLMETAFLGLSMSYATWDVSDE